MEALICDCDCEDFVIVTEVHYEFDGNVEGGVAKMRFVGRDGDVPRLGKLVCQECGKEVKEKYVIDWDEIRREILQGIEDEMMDD